MPESEIFCYTMFMNESDIQKQLDAQQEALTAIYMSVEKTRKYIMWSGIASLIFFIAPLIIFLIMIPRIIGTFTGSLGIDTIQVSDIVTQDRITDTFSALKDLDL